MATPTLHDSPVESANLGLATTPGAKCHTQQPVLGSVWSIGVTLCEVLADMLAVVTALLCSYGIYHYLELGHRLRYPLPRLMVLAFVLAMIMALLLDRAGAYRFGNSLLRVRETELILKVSLQGSLLVLTLSYLSNFLLSRYLLSFAALAIPAFLMVEKHLLYEIIRILHSRGYGTKRVLIYGAGITGTRLFSAITRSPKLGLDPVVLVDDDPALLGTMIYERAYQRRRCATVIHGPLSAEILREYDVDVIMIGIPSLSREKFVEVTQLANSVGATVSFVPYHHGPTLFWMDYEDIDGLLVASFRGSGADTFYEVTKRCFDFLAASVLLAVLWPLLLVLAAFIRATSPGPALFKQERVGYHGKVFRIFKFRTMFQDAPANQYCPTDQADPRITPLGRFLRRTSLDELPQLLNVLRGEMSLVGPRPEMPFIANQYTALHRQRLTVRPGLTGMWQLSADRAYLIHENIEYDLYYIRHRNFFMDMAVLLHTVAFAARGI